VTVYLGAYHFDGDRDELLAGYDRLIAQFPPGVIELNVCIAHAGGITVFDACPSSAAFAGFSQSAELLGAVAGAGLPAPRVEPLGDVHAATVGPSLTS
jgi:hypothetical protein